MEQRDLIKDQIEHIGKMLAYLISSYFGVKKAKEIKRVNDYTNAALTEELDTDIERLIEMSYDELKTYVEGRPSLIPNLDDFSILITKVGLTAYTSNPFRATDCFKAAVNVLDIADEVSAIASLDRMDKREELLSYVDDLREDPELWNTD